MFWSENVHIILQSIKLIQQIYHFCGIAILCTIGANQTLFSFSNQNRLFSFRADYDPMNIIIRFMIVLALHSNRINVYILILLVLFTYGCDLSLSFFYVFK